MTLIKIALIILIIYLAISAFIASEVVEPTAKHIDIAADFISSDFRDVSFKTSDNLIIKGWLFKPESNKVIVFVPGILDNRTNQGYYGTILAKELISKGYGVLMYDPRSRGDSQGKVKIRDDDRDVEAAFNFLKQNGYKPERTGIIAYSAGATSTLLAVNKLNGIGVVVLDSTPVFFKDVLDNILSREIGVPSFFLPGVHLTLKIIYKFDVNSLNPLRTISPSANTSFLILHAKNDATVPISNSQEIKDELGEKAELVVFPRGSHIETFKFNPEMYRNKVFKFLDEHLK